LLEFLRHFRGGVLAISHDRELLDQMDEILELTSQGLKKYGGGWTHYEEARDHERAQLERNLETAKRLRDQSARERQERIEAQDKRQRRGAKQAERGGMPKILLGARKRRAQDTSGKIDSESRERSELAVSEAWQAYQALKFDPVIFAKLQSSKLPAQQLIFEAVDYNIRFAGDDAWLWREDLRLSIRGPKKIAIRGGNGSGKSTLLKRLASENSPHEASAHLTSAEERGLLKCGPCRFASIDQDPHWQLNAHAGQLSLLEFAREHVLSAPTAKAAVLTEPALRGGLAAFLFPGDQVHKRLHQLSGGERLRLQLALAFLSPVPPEVLLLDEPTNNLDLPNIEFLEGALNSFQGGVIIASHDEWFLSKVRLDDEIRLSR
jgi:ATPase subunit of ABC transporter with duplicated ATPase domains